MPHESAGDAPAISLDHLEKSYGAIRAVRGLSLEVARGEIFGFLGLNGAGKTTTIRILLDLLRPTRGTAKIFGVDCQRDSLRARALVGYMPGDLGAPTDLTGNELLGLTERLSGARVDTAYRRKLAERLELSQGDLRRRLREYSTGMKRKLGLIQALQADPPLLILDEPTEGLDPIVQRELHRMLLDLRGRGRTVFMSSHVISEVERLCDRIGVIRHGEIVLLSTVEEARRRSGRIVRVHLARPAAAIALPAGMAFLNETPSTWTIRVARDLGDLLPLLSTVPVRDLEIVEPALEDVLRSFYREAEA